MTSKLSLFCIVLALFFMNASGIAQEFDELVLATEVLYDGEPPVDMAFRPGRILDANTIWFFARASAIFTGNVTYVFRSVDGGATFTHNAVGIPGRVAQMDAFDADTAVVATAEGFIYRTTDGGATWDSVYSYTISPTVDGWFDGCRVLSENVAVAYGDFEPDGNMHFVRTEDKGANWTEITGIDFLGSAYAYYTWGLAACTVGENIWCSATNTSYNASYVFRSFDLGVTWNSYLIPTEVIATYPRSIAFSDDNNGLIADRRGLVVKSTDGGATWTKTNNPDTSAAAGSWVNGVAAIPNSNIIMAMDDIGMYYTSDLGETWSEITVPDTTAGDYFVSGVFYDVNFGYVFTDNGLVLRFKDQVTGLAGQSPAQVPAAMRLYQNYPNPFNPVTTIEFDLHQSGFTTLKVFNLLGKEVATLVSGNMNQGHHTVTLNAADLSSGVYYYQLTAGPVSSVKKMILLK